MKKLLLILTLIGPAVHAMMPNGLAAGINATPHDQQQETVYRYRQENLRIQEAAREERSKVVRAAEEPSTISEHVLHFPGFAPNHEKEKSAYAEHINKQKDVLGDNALATITSNAPIAFWVCLATKGDQYLADTYFKYAKSDESIYQYFSRVGFR